MYTQIFCFIYIFINKTGMTSADGVRKRLNSLKNLTQQLKNSTTSGSINIHHIKNLIGNLKNISQNLPQTSQKQNPNDRRNQSFSQSTIQRINQEEQMDVYRPLFEDSKKKENHKRNQLSDEEQIIILREQNLRLQENLGVLRHQLNKLKQPSEVISEGGQKQLPFFHHNQQLSIFVCRFNIPQEDYQKIQYSSYQAQLKLDRLILIRRQKRSEEQFDLTTLQEVLYLDRCTALFRFQEFVNDQSLLHQSRDLTNVFFRFQSDEHLHKWDLSLFVNFHIVNSLAENRLFESYFRRIRKEEQSIKEDKQMAEIKNSKDLDDQKQKDLLQLLIKRRQDYLEVRNLIQEKLDPKKIQRHSNDRPKQENFPLAQNISNQQVVTPKNNTNLLDSDDNSSDKKLKTNQKDRRNVQKHQHSLSPSIIQQIDEVDQDQNKNSSIIGDTKYFSKPQQSGRVQIQNMGSPKIALTSSTTHIKNRLSNQLPNSSQLNYTSVRNDIRSSINTQQGGTRRNTNEREQTRNNSISQAKDNQKQVSAARINLQSGYYATKYSKDGFSPHQKKVFLSLDCKKLCWCERDKQSDYKNIPLEVITGVEYGLVGQGIAKHVKRPDARYFCVIQYFSGEYKKKTIQLGSGNYEEMKKFTIQLQIIINNARGIPFGRASQI